jgi:hypothetical protein
VAGTPDFPDMHDRQICTIEAVTRSEILDRRPCQTRFLLDRHKEIPMTTDPLPGNGTMSRHRHTVIFLVRVPDHPKPVRVVGALLHENGVPFAVVDRIGTGTAAILPDKLKLDPSLLRLRHNAELGAHYVYNGQIAAKKL